MNKNKKALITILMILCVLASFELTIAQRAYHLPFRYVIVHNEVIVNEHEPSATHRNVEVLLDVKAFSENTLRQLFVLLSKRFPSPDSLTVDVYTSLEQVDTPEERDAPQPIFESSGGNNKPGREELIFRKHPYAILIRQDGNELLRYRHKIEKSRLRTIVLKGRDPMP